MKHLENGSGRLAGPGRKWIYRTAAASSLACALAACGGGDAAPGAGSSFSAQTTVTAAPAGAATAAANAAPRLAAPFDPLVQNTNPAMKKLAAIKCGLRAIPAASAAKVPYTLRSTMLRRQEACAALAQAKPGG
jgi:hypothetical protein